MDDRADVIGTDFTRVARTSVGLADVKRRGTLTFRARDAGAAFSCALRLRRDMNGAASGEASAWSATSAESRFQLKSATLAILRLRRSSGRKAENNHSGWSSNNEYSEMENSSTSVGLELACQIMTWSMPRIPGPKLVEIITNG